MPAFVVRRGQADAGAIFISVDLLDGTSRLYEPAPTGVAGSDRQRFWMPCFEGRSVPEQDVTGYLSKQADFDPDLWIISVEDKRGRHFLGDALANLE